MTTQNLENTPVLTEEVLAKAKSVGSIKGVPYEEAKAIILNKNEGIKEASNDYETKAVSVNGGKIFLIYEADELLHTFDVNEYLEFSKDKSIFCHEIFISESYEEVISEDEDLFTAYLVLKHVIESKEPNIFDEFDEVDGSYVVFADGFHIPYGINFEEMGEGLISAFWSLEGMDFELNRYEECLYLADLYRAKKVDQGNWSVEKKGCDHRVSLEFFRK